MYMMLRPFLVTMLLAIGGGFPVQELAAKKATWGFQEFCNASNIALEDYPFNYEHHTMCDSGDEEEHAYFMSRLILDMKAQDIDWPKRNFVTDDYILNQNLFELEVRAIRLTEESLSYAVATMASSIRQEELKYLAREWDQYLAKMTQQGKSVEESYYQAQLTSMPGSYLKAYIQYTIRAESPVFMSQCALDVASSLDESSMLPAMVALAIDADTSSEVRSIAKEVVDTTFGVDSSDPEINWRELLAAYE